MSGSDIIYAAMHQAVRDGVFPGAVLAVRLAGRMKGVVVAGRLSTDPASEPVQAATVYDLASLTKPLATVSSILLLVRSGKIHLELPIQHILRELDASPVGVATVRDLLTHRSGLPGWRPLYERLEEKGMTPADPPAMLRQAVLELIRDEGLVYERGEKSLYSDLGFILLGFAVERVSGLWLNQFFDEHVVGPLRAQPLFYASTRSSQSRAPHEDPAGIAPTEYDERKGRFLRGEVHDDNAAAIGGVAGHAGLFGTAAAVLAVSGAWLNAYHGRASILDPELVREFTQRQSSPPVSSWALGWDTPSSPSSSGSRFSVESFGHLGYTGTSLWVDPLRELEVVLLSNRVHPNRKNDAIRAFRPLIHDLVVQEMVPAA